MTWNLIIGFILWEICKECNRRIFQDKNLHVASLMEEISHQLKETISRKIFQTLEEKPSPQEAKTLKKFNLYYLSDKILRPKEGRIRTGASVWQAPLEVFWKWNFNRTSNDNPRNPDVGGVIRDQIGKTQRLYFINMGQAKNIEVGFHAVEQGLEMLRKERKVNVRVEGNSTLAIQATRRL